jgi:uncharacterized protein (TIGR00255 family)
MPLHSMTAYGFGEAAAPGQTYTCEVRTLNSRFLEVSVRMPRHLLALETDIINHVKATLRRGKTDVFIDTQRTGAARELPPLDADSARHYASACREAAAVLSAAGVQVAPVSPVELLKLEGIFGDGQRKASRGADQAEAHREPVFAALEGALRATREARQKEGEALAVALVDLTRALEAERRQIALRRDDILANMHKTYTKRLDSVLAALAKAGQSVQAPPSERLASELALLAEKADIDEELTRLATHTAEFERLLATEDVGRKLDFLCQEMHREVNTMSNKLVQTEAAVHTIEMKQLVERIRQQVQNIE